MSHEFLVQQMTMTVRLLAIACFVCAQVKVEHPVYWFPGFLAEGQSYQAFLAKFEHALCKRHQLALRVCPLSHRKSMSMTSSPQSKPVTYFDVYRLLLRVN